MWEIEAIDYQKGTKPEVIAYFLKEEEADDYIAYLATVNVKATKSKVSEFYYVG